MLHGFGWPEILRRCHQRPPEHNSEDNLNASPPPKRPAGRKKKGAPSKTQRNSPRQKPTKSRSSSKPVRKKRTKECLGPAYISPPSSPSPPPVIDSANDHTHSPPHTIDPSRKLLSVGSSDVARGLSSIPGIVTPPHSRATCDRNPDIPPMVGHPDISDLFLEPQEQSSAEYYRSTLKYGEDLGRDEDSRLIHSEREISGGLLMTNETALHTRDANVSIDDLFG
ncbi:hypothetical protein GBAR_LOCUS15084 [Geodia barretti]|uniref:Uncharacterized protein n=1 Tax=Geodia barretti TaxID=519541 RepID=A0AA35WLT2_GEOBA|nr:hypothetical protein GBAR_LOCUS15084 [Geodia barretti]